MLHFIFIFLFLTNILNDSNASFTWKCSNSSETSNTSTTFVAAERGPAGRYVVEHCRRYNEYANSSWHLQLFYLDDSSTRTEETCRIYKYNQKVTLYARFQESLEDEDFLNCNYICYSKPLDLISNGCYVIKTWLKGKHTLQSSETMHYINSEANHFSYRDKVVASIVAISSSNASILVWYLGYIPATDYTIQLQKIHNTTNKEAEDHSHGEWFDVSANCTANVEENEVRCPLRLSVGCYHALLTHWAPWTQGSFFREKRSHVASFCYEQPAWGVADARAWAPWAAWAGALALAGVALGALLAWRSRVAAAWRRAVLDSWKRPRYSVAWSGAGSGPVVGMGPKERCVLLLYARDCAPFMRAMAALRDLVADATHEPVYDLFCPWTLALSASATHAWLRAALRATHTRVLVVQAPAAREFARTHRSMEAALGARLVYARPHASDALLQYALTLLADSAPLDPRAYHKYYIATICESPEDLLEHVAAFRRYELPAAAELLLEHLARPLHLAPASHTVYTPQPGLMRQFSDSLQEMTELVRTKPDYLDDLLMPL